MKKLNVSWNGINDPTGYLFSFAKSLSCVVKNSPYTDIAEDIIATSGFAFRMWLNTELCPSALSIWDFGQQPIWLSSGGLESTFVSCCWQPENVLKEARLDTLPKIKTSIENGVPVIAWDIGVLEWGLITGYDEDKQKFATLSITGSTDDMDYSKLGNREMPMLNVVTITSKTNKKQEDIITDTLKLAKSHLLGEEWCDENNKKGLDVYPHLINFFVMDDTKYATCWNMEYYLGTYAALKWYAWKFFEKYKFVHLADLYKTVYDNWQKAFDLKKSIDITIEENRKAIAALLKQAEAYEREAINFM